MTAEERQNPIKRTARIAGVKSDISCKKGDVSQAAMDRALV